MTDEVATHTTLPPGRWLSVRLYLPEDLYWDIRGMALARKETLTGLTRKLLFAALSEVRPPAQGRRRARG